MSVGPTDMLDGEGAGAGRNWLTDEDLAEATAAAAYLFPEDMAAAELCTSDDMVLSERLSLSENLHWMADEKASPYLHALADAIASPALHALVAWVAAYLAYRPFAVFTVGTTADAAAKLRAATRAILEATPRSHFELAMKIRFAGLVGVHACIGREFPDGGPEAATAYGRFSEKLERMPNWGLVGFFLRELAPEWINSLDAPPNRDEALILDLIREAGPSWEAAIGADVERLRAMRSGCTE